MSDPDVTFERVAAVHHRFQLASLEEGSWHDALSGLADLFGGPAAQLFAPCVPGGIAAYGAESAYYKSYVEYFHVRNPILPPLARQAVGTAAADWGLVERHVFERSEIYNDFMLPQDLSHGAAFVLEAGSGISQPMLLKVDRSPRAEPFSMAELRRLEWLGANVRGLLAISARHARAEAERAGLAAAADRLIDGQILLCSRGRIVQANAAAMALLAARDGVARTRSDELTAVKPGDAGKVERVLSQALHNPVGTQNLPRINAVRVRRREAAKGSLLIVALRLPQGCATAETAAHSGKGPAVVMVHLLPAPDSVDVPNLTVSQVSQLLEVKAAQARVVVKATEGLRSAAIASALGLAKDTVDTHLKQVFGKTGVDGIAGLRAALARLRVRLD